MKIYISGFSYDVNDGELKELFAEYGEVSSAKVITDRDTGKSRGFGFVEMPNVAEAQKAIKVLNGGEYDGKVITVNVAKEKTDRGSGFSGGGHRGGYNSRRY